MVIRSCTKPPGDLITTHFRGNLKIVGPYSPTFPAPKKIVRPYKHPVYYHILSYNFYLEITYRHIILIHGYIIHLTHRIRHLRKIIINLLIGTLLMIRRIIGIPGETDLRVRNNTTGDTRIGGFIFRLYFRWRLFV